MPDPLRFFSDELRCLLFFCCLLVFNKQSDFRRLGNHCWLTPTL